MNAEHAESDLEKDSFGWNSFISSQNQEKQGNTGISVPVFTKMILINSTDRKVLQMSKVATAKAVAQVVEC